MMHTSTHRRGKRRVLERGQGLAEYALILVLVAVVTILIVTVLGEQIQQVYCDVLLGLGSAAPEVEACEAPRVTCVGVPDGATVSGPIVVEAVVTDNDGPSAIQQVDFYVDNNHIRTEYYYRYCLGGWDDPCNSYPAHHLSNGPHTIRAVALDVDGYTGECTLTINVTH